MEDVNILHEAYQFLVKKYVSGKADSGQNYLELPPNELWQRRKNSAQF